MNFQLDFKLDATSISSFATLPEGNQSGTWEVIAALTRPGTLDVISLSRQSFKRLESVASSSNDTRHGAFNLFQIDATPEISTVLLYGGFWFESDAPDFGRNIAFFFPNNAFSGVSIDSCAYFDSIPNIYTRRDAEGFPAITLDAGVVQLSSSANAGVFSMGRSSAFGGLHYMQIGRAVDGTKVVSFDSFEAGKAYTIKGAGGADIGSFSSTAIAPEKLVLSSHLGAGLISHIADNDLNLTWAGGNGQGKVTFTIIGEGEGRQLGAVINCQFVDDGSGVIPASNLVKMKDFMGDRLDSLKIVISRNSSVSINTSNNTLEYGVFNIAVGGIRQFRLR